MKQKKDFLHIINDVDDKYVEEAMPPDRSGGGKSKRSIGPMLTKWLSVAACFDESQSQCVAARKLRLRRRKP